MNVVTSESSFGLKIVSEIGESDLSNLKCLKIEFKDEFLAHFVESKFKASLQQLGQLLKTVLQNGQTRYEMECSFEMLEPLLKQHPVEIKKGDQGLTISEAKIKQIALEFFGEVNLLKEEVCFYKEKASSTEVKCNQLYSKAVRLASYVLQLHHIIVTGIQEITHLQSVISNQRMAFGFLGGYVGALTDEHENLEAQNQLNQIRSRLAINSLERRNAELSQQLNDLQHEMENSTFPQYEIYFPPYK